ncbi:MAG: acyl carrier protein [Planctomyces sp.]|jgi:acyl carrier protein
MSESRTSLKSAAEIQNWLIREISQELQISSSAVKPELSIPACGIDSMQVVSLIARLEDYLSIRFSSNPLDDYPSIEQLSVFAAELANHQQSV